MLLILPMRLRPRSFYLPRDDGGQLFLGKGLSGHDYFANSPERYLIDKKEQVTADEYTRLHCWVLPTLPATTCCG